MLDKGISDLIGKIYANSRSAEAWDSVLDRLLELTDSRFVMISAVDSRDGNYSSNYVHGPDDSRFLAGMSDYRAGQYRGDPTLKFAMENPHSGSVSLRRITDKSEVGSVAEDYAEWVRSQLSIGDTIVRYTPPTDDLILGVSIHTRADRASHSADELRLFSLLFDHMENAARLAARPPAFDGIEPVILVDRRGLVCEMSSSAQSLLKNADGLFLLERGLRTSHRADQSRLDAMLISALRVTGEGSIGGDLALVRPSGRRPLLLTVKPYPAPFNPFEAFGTRALVRIVEPEANVQSSPRWASLFSLTPSEARLAATLLSGEENLRTTAQNLGIAYATARVHLASVFNKTGAHTQSQLVRLLTRLGVFLCCVAFSTLEQAARLL